MIANIYSLTFLKAISRCWQDLFPSGENHSLHLPVSGATGAPWLWSQNTICFISTWLSTLCLYLFPFLCSSIKVRTNSNIKWSNLQIHNYISKTLSKGKSIFRGSRLNCFGGGHLLSHHNEHFISQGPRQSFLHSDFVFLNSRLLKE